MTEPLTEQDSVLVSQTVILIQMNQPTRCSN